MSTKENDIISENNSEPSGEKPVGEGRAASSSDDTATEVEETSEIIGWNGPDDPENPLNWPKYQRVGHVVMVAAMSFVSPLESSIFAPSVPQVMKEFHATNTLLGTFSVSVFVLGYVIGPFVAAPLSELYGRLYVYHGGNILFVVFTIACAKAPSLPSLVGFRLLAGCAGAVPITIGGGTVVDVIHPQKRGAAMALYMLGIILGPTIGPVVAGFITQAKGWRWIFWILTIISGAITAIMLVFMRETYAPRILELKAARLRKETGNNSIRSQMHSGLSPKDVFLRAIVRPGKLLIFSPIVLLLSIYTGIAYGYLYLLFTTFSSIFEEQYHFGNGVAGLSYIGLGLGAVATIFALAIVSDKLMNKRPQEKRKAEDRLLPMIYGAPLIPVGLFWFGWSAKADTHWIVPIIGSFFITAGIICVFVPVQTYLVDAYTIYAASALACNAVVRSLFGATLPLAGQKMFKNLGYGWGASLLAFVAMAMAPIPLIFYYKGEYLRKKLARPL
ncbi:major facilitator superfamily domain-containing protein [Xylogone sp. PMI_703]|nr:major facilitator superfamily domain-containing protein [Xylogone sp. PMI_703]